jgi:hypothetical protein
MLNPKSILMGWAIKLGHIMTQFVTFDVSGPRVLMFIACKEWEGIFQAGC